eukprot:gene16448-biopygen8867
MPPARSHPWRRRWSKVQYRSIAVSQYRSIGLSPVSRYRVVSSIAYRPLASIAVSASGQYRSIGQCRCIAVSIGGRYKDVTLWLEMLCRNAADELGSF